MYAFSWQFGDLHAWNILVYKRMITRLSGSSAVVGIVVGQGKQSA